MPIAENIQMTKKVSIREVKANFIRNFPSNPLSEILSNEPDYLSYEELIAKAGTWLVISQRGPRRSEK